VPKTKPANCEASSAPTSQPRKSRAIIVPSTVYKKQENDAAPFKVIGRISLQESRRNHYSYAWTIHSKLSSDSAPGQADEEKQSQPAELEETKQPAVHEERSTEDEKDLNNIVSAMQKDSDLLNDLDDKSWLGHTKGSKSRPRAISDKKLAVRSDVVNKTLLRSLKRYYTAKFENDVKYKSPTKSAQKDELFLKLQQFTSEIYQDDPRFDLPEFSGVTMEDLVFYMGI